MRTAYGSAPFVAGGDFIDGIQRRAYKLEKQRYFEQRFEILCNQVNPELLTVGNMRRIADMISEQMEQEVRGTEEKSKMLTTTFVPSSEPRLHDAKLASILHLARQETDVHWELRERSGRRGFWPFRSTFLAVSGSMPGVRIRVSGH